MLCVYRMEKEEQRKVHLAFGFAGRTVSVVSGKEVTEMKKAAAAENQKAGGKGLNRVIQRKDKNAAASSRTDHNVPVAPNVDVEPVYAMVKAKKGEAAVAISKADGSLDKFLESLRFQQIEDDYFQGDDKNKSDDDDDDEHQE